MTSARHGPPPVAVRVDGDKTCATLIPGAVRRDRPLRRGRGRSLANVFVHVTSGLDRHSFPVPSAPVLVDQQRCWYTPRVVGVRVGQPFQVVNSDPLLHNVRADAHGQSVVQPGPAGAGMRYSHTFATDEVMVAMRCDVHAWMRAWVGVVSHPYFAVTGRDGTFRVAPPAGRHLHGGGVA